MKILVVEDEKDLNNIICKQLEKNKYIVDTSCNGKDALDMVRTTTYDLIISDISMPVLDGFTFIRMLRDMNIETPVIFLTARDDIQDKINGLDLGASDYIVKPFMFEELLARIRVVTRKNALTNDNVLKIYDLTLNIKTHEVIRNNEIIKLSSKEFSILKYMLINKNIVLSREKIENALWNFEYEGASNMIDVYIRYLRKKIDDQYDNKIIHTIRGAGYVAKEE
ncbi:MAG: response regulator transcription factor [bacterium]